MDATSLKLEIAFLKKELSVLLIRSRRPSYHNEIQQPKWKSLELREKQASTVSHFGEDWNAFWQGIGTLSGRVGTVETYLGTNARS
jgi:uncharacterized membrane protein (UPF0127 family)